MKKKRGNPKRKVGILIKNSKGGVLHNVIAEGPDGGIDMENVEDMTMHNVVGRSIGKSLTNLKEVWHKTWWSKIIIGVIATVVGGIILSFIL